LVDNFIQAYIDGESPESFKLKQQSIKLLLRYSKLLKNTFNKDKVIATMPEKYKPNIFIIKTLAI
jgi:hypothetical protein